MPLLCLMMFEVPALSTNMWLDYTKMLLVLIGICLLAFVGVKVLLPKLTGFVSPASQHIQVFAKCPLEPRKTLYLVRAGKTVVLLASSADAVQFMSTLNPEDFDEIPVPAQANVESGSAFRRIAQTLIDQNQKKSL